MTFFENMCTYIVGNKNLKYIHKANNKTKKSEIERKQNQSDTIVFDGT